MTNSVKPPSNKGRGHKIIGQFWSPRLNREFWFESVPEFNYCYHLEFDHEVRSYCVRPALDDPLVYRLHGVEGAYTPDFEVVYHDPNRRTRYLEMKPEDVANYHEYQEKAAAIGVAFRNRRCDFDVVTAEQAEAMPRLSNLKMLYYHVSRPIGPNATELCRTNLRVQKTAQARMVAGWLAPLGYGFGEVWALVANGTLAADLDSEPFNPLTPLSLR